LRPKKSFLRHVDLHPQDIGVRDGEQRRSAIRVRGDQAADVDLPTGDHAIERRDHTLEAGKLYQLVHLRLLRLEIGARHPDGGDAACICQPSLIAALLAGPAQGCQLRQATIRYPGKLHVRL
jgi:hypothetical protein